MDTCNATIGGIYADCDLITGISEMAVVSKHSCSTVGRVLHYEYKGHEFDPQATYVLKKVEYTVKLNCVKVSDKCKCTF